jgi:hypothetical protein
LKEFFASLLKPVVLSAANAQRERAKPKALTAPYPSLQPERVVVRFWCKQAAGAFHSSSAPELSFVGMIANIAVEMRL